MINMEGKGLEANGLRSFQQCYKMCCRSENIIPLKNLAVKNNGHTLDFCIDRIKYADWAPVFIALSDDLTLQCLAIRCRTQAKTVLEQVDSERMARNVTRSPVILTSFMLNNLVDSISQCVSQTSAMTMLQLEGLPLFTPYMSSIATALGVNHSLKHISLHGCLIGDSGCQKVCTALRCAHNVITLNLSSCNITSNGAVHIAELIKFLKIYRYSENWKQTLRYQNPDLDSMTGLRRITLSNNSEFGDSGVLHIIEVLLDDLWIKAIDLQQCGLTETVMKNCLQLLEYNATLHVLDLRYNPGISMKSIGSIAIGLRKNENNTSFDQTWLTESNTSLVHKDQKFPTKCKMVQKKEKNLMPNNTSQLVGARNEDSRSLNDLVHVNMLKEQLKQESAHRKQLEELNGRLLHQIKELKHQQITQWKTTQRSDTNDTKSFQPNKCKQLYTINLNDGVDHIQTSANTGIIRCHHKNKMGDGLEETTTRSTKNTTKIKKMTRNKTIATFSGKNMMSGADILEQLIERRFNSRNGSKADDEDVCNIDFSSDSSSTETTVRRVNLHDSGDATFKEIS